MSAIHISYCLTAQLDERAVREAVEQLSVEERARHGRFVFARDRRDFAVAHALLRRSLSAHGDRAPHEWRFTAGAHGKPALSLDDATRTPLMFNLTHTDGLVACAVARDAELGIDVEAIDRHADILSLANRYFSPTEAAGIAQCAEDARQTRFIEIWTLKEAYVKALGEGLSCPLHEFAFVFEGPSGLRFEGARTAPPTPWCFALFAPSDRHRMAIAVRGEAAHERELTVRADPPDDARPSARHIPLRVS